MASSTEGKVAAANGSLYNHVMMFVWLGIIHYTVAVAAVAAYFLPHPVAVAVLCAWVALAVLPNRPPYPTWGLAIARAICNAAGSYFPLSLEFEDEAGYLAAAKAGTPTVIGLEPHSVLPISIGRAGAPHATPRSHQLNCSRRAVVCLCDYTTCIPPLTRRCSSEAEKVDWGNITPLWP